MRVVIFANGVIDDLDAEVARWVRAGNVIVAANGGTRYVLAAGLHPDHIIGDLDSFNMPLRAHLETKGTIFHPHPPAKNETDLELAILWAANSLLPSPTPSIPCSPAPLPPCSPSLIILGALGGRPDQELANLLLLALPSLAGLDVVIADGAWVIHCLHGGQTHHLHGHPGHTLSLIPLGGPAEGVTTTGLAYPLHDETLHFGPARGVSNVFAGTEASVSVKTGLLWCFHKT
ncbi:MAG: thiamine diphosphokinase [Anaerolineae bacterium]|nr:thiamine diphosphokinase [Anaerolineae bacterium]